MFTTSADLTDLPTVAPDDEVVGFVGMAVLAVSLGLLSMDAATSFTLSMASLTTAFAVIGVGVLGIVWVALRAMGSVLPRILRATDVLSKRFRSIQMTRFDATPMRAANAARTFSSSVMAKVINGSVRGNRPNPVVVSPTMGQLDLATVTTRPKLSISVWIHVARPFQTAIRKATSFGEKAGLVIIPNLFGKQRVTVTLPAGVVLSTPTTGINGFIATPNRTSHRRKSITQVRA